MRAAGQTDRERKLLGLIRRQYEILVLLAKGYAIKGVSRELNVSASTIKTYAEALTGFSKNTGVAYLVISGCQN